MTVSFRAPHRALSFASCAHPAILSPAACPPISLHGSLSCLCPSPAHRPPLTSADLFPGVHCHLSPLLFFRSPSSHLSVLPLPFTLAIFSCRPSPVSHPVPRRLLPPVFLSVSLSCRLLPSPTLPVPAPSILFPIAHCHLSSYLLPSLAACPHLLRCCAPAAISRHPLPPLPPAPWLAPPTSDCAYIVFKAIRPPLCRSATVYSLFQPLSTKAVVYYPRCHPLPARFCVTKAANAVIVE